MQILRSLGVSELTALLPGLAQAPPTPRLLPSRLGCVF